MTNGQQASVPPPAELAEKQSLAMELSNGLVGLLSRYTGRGPTRARTTVNTNVIVGVFEDTLTKGESSLVAAGNQEAVCDLRSNFQAMMQDEAKQLVEQLTGRTVVSCLADVDPDAAVAIQVFVLDRQPETNIAATAETAGNSA
jgi:uncharacterized protein YbcI